MATGKRIALKDYIEVDGVDLSDLFSQIGFSSVHDKVDVSGFNSAGSDEFLAGKTTQSVTGQVFGSMAALETWDILYPIHRDRSIVTFKWRPDSSLPVSATNASLEGNVQLLTWNAGATRGDVESFPVEFSPADATGLVYVAT
jgi:hypothetical protein